MTGISRRRLLPNKEALKSELERIKTQKGKTKDILLATAGLQLSVLLSYVSTMQAAEAGLMLKN